MNTKLALAITSLAFLLPIGALAQTSSGTMCYDLYKPVCGTHQVECFAAPCYPVYETYSNSCFLNAQGATYVHDGECTANEQGMASSTPTPTPKPYVPPKGCIAYNDGCNSCSVQKNGGTVCTQMACLPPTHPGYCTAYAGTTTTTITTHPATPVVTNPAAPSSIEVTASSSATATTTTVHVGFFANIWNALKAFFAWF